VAICVVNPSNEVLLVRHREHRASDWQFPQGGVKPGDTLEQTVRHELREELGLIEFKPIVLRKNVYQYRWPKRLLKYGQDPEKKAYVGQVQSLSVVRVAEVRPKLKPDPREAAFVKWVPYTQLLRSMHPVRRPLGKLAMVELEKLIKPERRTIAGVKPSA